MGQALSKKIGRPEDEGALRPHLSLLLLAACQSEVAVVSVPFEEGDRSAVVGIQIGSSVEIYALDVTERQSNPILRSIKAHDSETVITVGVLYYAQPLQEIGLTAGPVQSVADGRPLPQQKRAVVGRFLDGETNWQTVEDPPEPLASFEVSRGCEPLRVLNDLDLPDLKWPADLVWAHPGEAYLVRPNNGIQFIHVDETGVLDTTLLEIPSFFAIATAPDGRLWLADRSTLIHGTPRAGFVTTATFPPSRDGFITELAPAGEAESSDTVYTLHADGTFGRFATGQWQALGSVEDPGHPFIEHIVWIGPEELIISFGNRVYHYDGQITEHSTARETNDRIVELATIPGLGEFLTTSTGLLLQRIGEHWAVVEEPTVYNASITDMAPFHHGMALVNNYGTIDQFYPGGYCEGERVSLGVSSPINHMTVVGDRIYATGIRAAPFLVVIGP